MTIRWAISILFLSVLSLGRAQTTSQSLNYRIDLTQFDFFTGIEYARKYNRFQPFTAFEIGINRTIFQQRFYPKFSVGLSYDLLKSDKILLGPTFHYGYSILKVNRNSSHFHQWNEIMGGVRFEIGSKWKYVVSAEYGFIGETYFDQQVQDKETIATSGYVISMGVCYAW
jgi:hypothetical protein